jgi:aldehyde dehydrogenase (NAD+)
MPIAFSSMSVVSSEMAAGVFDHHAGWIDKICGSTYPTYEAGPTGGDVQIMSFREPVGVVAAIIPWNAPMMLFAQKVAPALATGCTLVVKPSEFAVLTSLKLAALIDEAGFPPGVFNLIPGPGNPTGEALITHPGVDKVTFTGSRAVGKRILEASGDTVKRVTLELGGKSPSIVFEDAPSVEGAAMMAMGMVSMGLSGQGCVCQTRSLVHRSVYDAFVNAAASLVGMVQFGDPFDSATTSSAIINKRQLDKVLGFIEKAPSQGARLVAGGDRPGGDLSQGNFVNPTLFADVDNSMTVAREEVFGPVLVAMPFDDEAHAIALANDTEYGLGAGVYTTNIARAFRVARAVRAGTVGVNEYTVWPNAPFGGMKQSGLGREGGWGSIEAFTETKSVVIGLSG